MIPSDRRIPFIKPRPTGSMELPEYLGLAAARALANHPSVTLADEPTAPLDGQRKGWIRDRLEFLATVIGIDCLTFSIMSSHAHLVLRSRPEVVAAWSDVSVLSSPHPQNLWVKLVVESLVAPQITGFRVPTPVIDSPHLR